MIILAWLPLPVSLTLAALLTVILLPLAWVKVRRSPDFAAMTLLAVSMLRRGEAWKTVFLRSERQLLEQQQPQQTPTLPRIMFFDRGNAFLDAVVPPFRGAAIQLVAQLCLADYGLHISGKGEGYTENHGTLAERGQGFYRVSPVPFLPLSARIFPNRASPLQ